MIVLVKGVERVSGTSKGTSKPYDFSQLIAVVPAECVSTPTYNRQAFGLQDMKPLALDSALLPFFAKIPAQNFPISLDLTIELRPNFGEFQNTVTAVAFLKQAA